MTADEHPTRPDDDIAGRESYDPDVDDLAEDLYGEDAPFDDDEDDESEDEP